MKWRELFELFRQRTRKAGNWIELFKHFQKKKKKNLFFLMACISSRDTRHNSTGDKR